MYLCGHKDSNCSMKEKFSYFAEVFTIRAFFLRVLYFIKEKDRKICSLLFAPRVTDLLSTTS